eukprot:SAG22_NODE_19940_length_270_cov_0.608187_1_plen_32_part_01
MLMMTAAIRVKLHAELLAVMASRLWAICCSTL